MDPNLKENTRYKALYERKDLRHHFFYIILVFFCCSFFSTPHVFANDFESILKALGSKSRTQLKKAVNKLGDLGNPMVFPVLEALKNKRLVIDKTGRLIILNEAKNAGRDALTENPVNIQSLTLKSPRMNNAVRRALSLAIGKLKLNSPDASARLSAAEEILKRPSDSALDLVRTALEKEKNDPVRNTLSLILAKDQLNNGSLDERIQAIKTMGEFGDTRFKSDLERLLEKNKNGEYLETDENIRKAGTKALDSIQRRQFFINQIANLFYGLSLGSILLLAALGLAITFGLMGVINMAHGEMLMLGAYSTYFVQNLFKTHLPSAFDWYLIAAIPAAFAISALVGILMERSVIRHLYGRPLETLLATWGISLLIIQTIRLIFGAQNVEVANPSWLSGGTQLFQGVVLPFNRIAIIIFVVFVVTLVWALLQKTSLGLQVRAVTQNRSMASCIGISTVRVDMWTFGLGSGVAGLGGMALSQIGNVGPELGQFYIVDSFMVVVLGGVGKIAGTVVGAVSLGIINKFLEPVAGAVLGKILVLVLIILMIQKRPQGLFALKGRTVES
ncbi:MAG: urea ABC transporter permease subunit UrtB [Nitrospinota bacterium]|nr:urea ABC transporter permease subunit UrtB [Nitrospinota bacterium]